MTTVHIGSARPTADPAAPVHPDRQGVIGPAVSVVVPTYDEAANLPILLRRLDRALAELDHEIIVVDDDSPDGTWRVARDLARHRPALRVIRRIGERGLSSAVVAGMAAATGRTLAVLDADLQHDEAILPRMVEAVLDGGVDLCVGSRGGPDGSYGDWGPGRRLVSWGGAVLARAVLGLELADPMSGYFVVSRRRFDEVRAEVDPRGFKILLELLARGPRPRVAEVGYRFGQRQHGTTKLDGSVVVAYLLALASLGAARWPLRRRPRPGARRPTRLTRRTSRRVSPLL